MATSPPKKPVDESKAPANEAYSSSWPTRYPRINAALALQLFGNFLIAFVFELQGGGSVVAGLALGFLFGQVTLLAIWTAWAPVSLFLRISSGLLMTGFVSLTLTVSIMRHARPDLTAPLLFSTVFFGQWLLSQGPLWLMRWTVGLHIGRAEDPPSGDARRDAQFGVGQLLILTACVAVLLGAARWLFPPEALEAISRDSEALAIAAILATFNTLAPLPAVWACFASRRAAPMWVAFAAFYVTGLMVAEHYALRQLNPGPMDWFLLWLHLALIAVVVATLLAFRKYGFRLVVVHVAQCRRHAPRDAGSSRGA